MGFIVECTLSLRIMEETTHIVPNMVIEFEDLRFPETNSPKFIFWARGNDYERLEAGMKGDSTIESFALLAELDDRRLYRVNFSEKGKRMLVYSPAVEWDIVFLDVTVSHDVSEIRAWVPHRKALNAYRDECNTHNISFRLDKIYQEEFIEASDQYGLTNPQYEALVIAYEQGYFDAERESSLEEIAEDLGISRQALSARLRRGHRQLIASTLI